MRPLPADSHFRLCARGPQPAALPLFALWVASFWPLPAAALDLPVVYPEREAVTGPAYLGDRFEIRLARAAAKAARLDGIATPEGTRRERLGVPSVDRLGASLGGMWFEPEFRGESAPAEGTGETDFTAFYIAHLPSGASLENALEGFRGLAEVMSADPIAVLPVSRVPNDSLWGASTWYFNPIGRHDIHATEAWDVITGDSAVVVGILDTGVIPYHPDLGGTIAGWSGLIWTNRAEAQGVAGVDDDGNGYVDDAHGWDFVDLGSGSGVPPAEDWSGQDNDPNDYAGHGTAVAGVVGALSDNGIGVAGTAWNVRLMPLRIGWSSACCPFGLVDMSFVAQALRYATRMRADVVNCSFATLNLSGLYEAAGAAVRAGVTIVSAAGNDGQPHELAEREDVVAVAATTSDDHISFVSNRGPYVDLAAPGEDITTTCIEIPRTAERRPGYVTLTGTSFSAPMVSGCVALMQAQRGGLGMPRMTPVNVLLRLRETADDIASINAGATGYGTGRLNLFRALTDPPSSNANRLGARTVGAAVVMPRFVGPRVTAYATTDRKLLFLAGREDTLRVVPLPGDATSGIAAANLSSGGTIGMFVSISGGRMAGYDGFGTPLPGWPVSTAGPELSGGPALGDLDDDGVLEVVCGAGDGRVWAWRTNGAVVPGFPVLTEAAGVSGSIALSNLDGNPGVEIVVATATGTLHVLDRNGQLLSGWPVTLGTPIGSPVVIWLGDAGPAAIVVTADTRLWALTSQGATVFNAPLTNPPTGVAADDPAIGDLDGDGADEIVVATSGVLTVAVFDFTGSMLTSRGWPYPLSTVSVGPPVIGQLRDADTGNPEVLLMLSTGLVALTDSAQALRTFPKPGGAGALPTLVDLESSGSTQVLAGSGPDSLLYIYDAGQGSAAGAAAPWPTPRANFARTGSRVYAPPLTTSAPGSVSDVHVVAASESTITLQWTATADDGPSGRPDRYLIAAAEFPIDDLTFAAALRATPLATSPPGGLETARIEGLTRARQYWLAIKARDEDGNLSVLSNVVVARTLVGGPLRGRSGVALASRTQPSRLPVELYWQGTGSAPAGTQFIQIFDAAGRHLRRLWLGAEFADVVQWDGRDDHNHLVPAGLYFARLTSGSVRAQARVVLLP